MRSPRSAISGLAMVWLAAACAPKPNAPREAPTSSPAPPSPGAAARDAKLELVVLGSGGPGATGRAGSAYVVLVDGVPRVLVDAGPGSFARLGESELSLARADLILLTHLHVDHSGELPGLLKARAVASRAPLQVRVVGPAGSAGGGGDARFPSTSAFVELLFGRAGAFAYLEDFAAPLTITAQDIAATQVEPLVVSDEAGLKITAVAGHHRDAPAVLYRLDYAGASITFSGDVDPTGQPALRALAAATSLLVFNTVVLDPPGSPEILYTLHSTPRAIGELAGAAGVGQLLLSHLTPAVEQHGAAVEASIRAGYRGPIQRASDGLRVPL